MTTCVYLKPTEDKPCLHYVAYHDKDVCGLCDLEHSFLCTEELKIKSPVLTQSALKAFAQCPEKYKKHYMDGTVLRDEHLSEPMKVGLLWGAFVNSLNEV